MAATACLALFANGESRNELGQEVAQQEQQAKAAVAGVARKGAKPLKALGNKIHDARTTYVPLPGDDGYADGGYGKPMDGGIGGGGGGGGFRPARGYVGGPPVLGQGDQQPAVLPADASPFGGSASAGGGKPKKQRPPTDEELERLEAASEARS